MKTKDLIAALQQADPSGEEECCIGNADIHFVENIPAYYDGALQILVRDPILRPYFDVVGARFVRGGRKVKIHYLTISDLVWDRPETVIDYSELSEDQQKRYKENHAKIREESLKMEENLECGHFINWFKGKAIELIDDFEDWDMVKEFYRNNLSRNVPFPENIRTLNASYVDRRFAQWDMEFEVYFDGLDLKIRKKS